MCLPAAVFSENAGTEKTANRTESTALQLGAMEARAWRARFQKEEVKWAEMSAGLRASFTSGAAPASSKARHV
jgi:hypothetical protein